MSLRFVPCIFHASYIPEKRNQLELGSNHPRLDFYPGTQDFNGSCPLIGLPGSFFGIRRKFMASGWSTPVMFACCYNSPNRYFYLPHPTAGVRTSHVNCFPILSELNFPFIPGTGTAGASQPCPQTLECPGAASVPGSSLGSVRAWRSWCDQGLQVWFRKLGMSWNLWGFNGLPYRTFLVI